MEGNRERKVIAHFQNLDTYRKLQRYRPHDRQILLEKGVEYILRNLTGDEIDSMLEENKLPYTTGRPKGVPNKVRDSRDVGREAPAVGSGATSADVRSLSRVKGIAVRPALHLQETAGKDKMDDLGLSNLE
jgi:hypothetical protein